MATARVGDLEIAYEVQGEGPALLMVAGTGYPGKTWWPPLLDRLSKSRTVITYDHRGTGRTQGDADGLTTRRFAEDALGLLAALGVGSAAILGHSMGGRVAQWMALDGPEKVTRLVLAASGPGPLPGSVGHTLGVPIHAATDMVELGYQEYVRTVQRQTFFTDEFAVEHPDVVDWLAQAFWSARPGVRDYFAHISARQQHDTVTELLEIQQPTLVIVGALDTHSRGTGSHLEQSKYLAQTLPNAELVVLPGLKHGYLWQAPDDSAALIERWLGDD